MRPNETVQWQEAIRLWNRIKVAGQQSRAQRATEQRTQIDAWKPRLLTLARERGGISRCELDRILRSDSADAETQQDAHQAFDELETEGKLRRIRVC